MDSFFLQNELTPKRLAFLAKKPDRPSGQRQGQGLANPEPAPEREEGPAQGPEQEEEKLLHLSESIRERITELNAEELLSTEEENESPQEIVNRLKDLSKAPDAKIIEWYGTRYSPILRGGITSNVKNQIRDGEIARFKDMVGSNAAKELDTIIADSPTPMRYEDALDYLRYEVRSIDTAHTKDLIRQLKLHEDDRRREAYVSPAVQYLELLRKKTDLEQKLRQARPKIAEIDEKIKQHKEAAATIEESKNKWVDVKRSFLLKGIKWAGYLSLAGGWVGAMSALTGVGGLGLWQGLTWLPSLINLGAEKIVESYEVSKLSQVAIAALSLIPINFGINTVLDLKAKYRHWKEMKQLEATKTEAMKKLEVEKNEKELEEAEAGMKTYRGLNLNNYKLFQDQKRHYTKAQEVLMREIDSKRKRNDPIDDVQAKLVIVTKTILSLESMMALFSVSEGDRGERVLALPQLDHEKIVENIQAMEDKLEPQLSQNLLSLATREQERLVKEQSEAKNIVKRQSLQEELKVVRNFNPIRVFFEKISKQEEFSVEQRGQANNIRIYLEQDFPRTARLLNILLNLPKTLFRKQLAYTVLNIMDMKDQEEGGVGGRPVAGGPDAGAPVAGGPDAGAPDAGRPDAGAPGAGAPGAGAPGAGAPAAGAPAAGAPGAGAPGAGAPGAGGPGAGAPPEADRPQPIDYAPEGIGGFSAEELEFAYPNIFGYGYPLNSPAMADERLLLSDPQSNTSKMLRILLEEGLDEANNRIVLLAKQLHQKYKRVVTSHNLPSSQFGEHITWAAWDICKQLLYHRGLSQPDRRYIIGDPFRSKELQQQIIDRHLGWEMHQHYHETGRLQLPADHPNRELIRNVFRYQEPRYEGDWQIPSLAYSKVGELIRTGFVEVPDDEDDRSAEPPEPPKPDDKESNENLENTKKLIEDLKKTIDELQGSIRNLEDIPPTDDVVGRGIRAEIAEQKRALLGYQKNLSNLQTLINTNS